jgi:hypothetical protein
MEIWIGNVSLRWLGDAPDRIAAEFLAYHGPDPVAPNGANAPLLGNVVERKTRALELRDLPGEVRHRGSISAAARTLPATSRCPPTPMGRVDSAKIVDAAR